MHHLTRRFLSVILAPSSATRGQRQAVGTAVLVAVILMVAIGGFYLKEGVGPGTSLLFWGICFLLVLWAVFLAYLNVKSIKEEFRAQRRELFFSSFSQASFRKKFREKSRSQSPLGERDRESQPTNGTGAVGE